MGNIETGTSQPLTTLRARNGIANWDELGSLIEQWRPGVVVVGQPLNMDGSESEMSRLAGKFARRLQGRFNTEFEMVDERLSSFEAKQQLREAGHSGDFKTNPADDLAAALILRSWLENRAR